MISRCALAVAISLTAVVTTAWAAGSGGQSNLSIQSQQKVDTNTQDAVVPPAKLPAVQQPTKLPAVQLPTKLPAVQQPTKLPAVQQPTKLPAVQQPTKLPAVQQPTRLPAVQEATKLPAVQAPGINLDQGRNAIEAARAAEVARQIESLQRLRDAQDALQHGGGKLPGTDLGDPALGTGLAGHAPGVGDRQDLDKLVRDLMLGRGPSFSDVSKGFSTPDAPGLPGGSGPPRAGAGVPDGGGVASQDSSGGAGTWRRTSHDDGWTIRSAGEGEHEGQTHTVTWLDNGYIVHDYSSGGRVEQRVVNNPDGSDTTTTFERGNNGETSVHQTTNRVDGSVSATSITRRTDGSSAATSLEQDAEGHQNWTVTHTDPEGNTEVVYSGTTPPPPEDSQPDEGHGGGGKDNCGWNPLAGCTKKPQTPGSIKQMTGQPAQGGEDTGQGSSGPKIGPIAVTNPDEFHEGSGGGGGGKPYDPRDPVPEAHVGGVNVPGNPTGAGAAGGAAGGVTGSAATPVSTQSSLDSAMDALERPASE